jgi:hypothetical protein
MLPQFFKKVNDKYALRKEYIASMNLGEIKQCSKDGQKREYIIISLSSIKLQDKSLHTSKVTLID